MLRAIRALLRFALSHCTLCSSSRVWAALAKKQETEQLGEEIWNIVSVTGLAGVAATVLGWAGTLLLF